MVPQRWGSKIIHRIHQISVTQIRRMSKKSGSSTAGKAKENESHSAVEESTSNPLDKIVDLFAKGLNLVEKKSEAPEEKTPKEPLVLEELTLNGIVEYIKSGKCKNVITMAGAGISTSAGIPDFRSPGSGLYNNLSKYNLPSAEAIFHIGYFKKNPEPFFALAKELYPGNFEPTISHRFIKLLHEKGLLLRHYTQNIDTLERIAGIPGEKLVEAHGTFHTSHCLKCRKEYDKEWAKEKIFNDIIPRCEDCQGLVKPDIVFFGEALPGRFSMLHAVDYPKCDLLIVIGTSLSVHPFAGLVTEVPKRCPRLLINRERVGGDLYNPFDDSFDASLNFDPEVNVRDVAYIGDSDEGCLELIEKLGWKDDFDALKIE